MARTTSAPKVPGETSPAATISEDPNYLPPDAGDFGDSALDKPTGANPAADVETVSVPKADLDALFRRMAALEAAQKKPASTRANPSAELPDADSINPDEIKTAVLTKQGWVVPTGYGTPPNVKPL